MVTIKQPAATHFQSPIPGINFVILVYTDCDPQKAAYFVFF